jgi:hypothetical protein
MRVKRSAGPYGTFNWTAEVIGLIGISTIERIEVHAASLHGEGACVEATVVSRRVVTGLICVSMPQRPSGETTTLDMVASSSEIEAFCRDRCGLHVTATRSAAQPGNTFTWSITFLARDGDVPALFADDSTHYCPLLMAGGKATKSGKLCLCSLSFLRPRISHAVDNCPSFLSHL